MTRRAKRWGSRCSTMTTTAGSISSSPTTRNRISCTGTSTMAHLKTSGSPRVLPTAYLDFDNDGDLDLLIASNNGPARLLRNDNANQNDVLRVKLVGTKSNRDGIGAKVFAKPSNGPRQLAVVKTGSSYLSQSELPVT